MPAGSTRFEHDRRILGQISPYLATTIVDCPRPAYTTERFMHLLASAVDNVGWSRMPSVD